MAWIHSLPSKPPLVLDEMQQINYCKRHADSMHVILSMCYCAIYIYITLYKKRTFILLKGDSCSSLFSLCLNVFLAQLLLIIPEKLGGKDLLFLLFGLRTEAYGV